MGCSLAADCAPGMLFKITRHQCYRHKMRTHPRPRSTLPTFRKRCSCKATAHQFTQRCTLKAAARRLFEATEHCVISAGAALVAPEPSRLRPEDAFLLMMKML